MAHLEPVHTPRQVRLPLLLATVLACCSSQPSAPEGTGQWMSVSTADAPSAGLHDTAVSGGSEVFVWGGLGGCTVQGACGTGARLDPETNTWAQMTEARAPSARYLHTAVWTGTHLLIWGGLGCGTKGTAACGDGAAYDAHSDTWTPLATLGAPSARGWQGAAWTGTEMLIWGGEEPTGRRVLGDGARYEPRRDTWGALPSLGAPSPRRYHTVVWTGAELLVWGGSGDATQDIALDDGAAWSPTTNAWRALSRTGAPRARWAHTSVWTGTELLIWGGLGCTRDATGNPERCADGARYDPAHDTWKPLSTANAPSARTGHTAVWTGQEMLVWGGAALRCVDGSAGACQDGAAYTPVTDSWRPLARRGAPPARASHSAAWTGQRMLVWGGVANGGSEVTLNDGALLAP
ncbi:hypothetical protein DRW03_00345 [Corallococcus sp. H22C18031201]|nr:hypothetical protein DRW03_00345 [Corallococcus sp. H22C18031201]